MSWDETSSVGSPVVDGPHRQQLAVVNALYGAMVDGQGEGATGDAPSDLERYKAVHLAYEENLLRKALYPDSERHRTMHDAMRRAIAGSRRATRWAI